MRKGQAAAVALLLVLLTLPHRAQGALGDGGLWFWFEYRQPIVGNASTSPPRFSLRILSDTRLFFRAQGLDEQFLRVGGIYDVNRWFWLAVNGTVYVDRQLADLSYQMEARLEVEPHFTARFWRFTLDDRNRLEFRFRTNIQRPRYRNMLRINYEPMGARWIPFVWNEWLFNLDRGFDQNRIAVGIARKLNSHVRLDLTYVVRSLLQPNNTWVHDQVFLIYLFVGLPPARIGTSAPK